jgi:UDP-glucose 4-epimerase
MKDSDSTCIALIGAGFIGKHLVRSLLRSGHVLRVLDRNPCPAEFVGKLVWVQGDFHDNAALTNTLFGVGIVYHLVSSTVPGDLHVDVARELHENVVGTLGVANACVIQGVRRFVFVSSASVYGIQEHFPVREDASTWPISAHGIHKLAVEKFLSLAHWEHGLDVRIIRLANPYGPGQSITGRQGFVAIAIGCLLRGATLTLRDGGRMVRDFIYIDDAVEALVEAGVCDRLPLVLNIGAGKGYRLRDVVDQVEHLTGLNLPVADAPPRKIDIPASVLDVTLASKTLGFVPRISLREGVARTLAAVMEEVGVQLNSSLERPGTGR